MDYLTRLNYLKSLKRTILKYELEIKQALFEDLGKSSQESYSTEIGIVLLELSLFIKKLKKWMKPKRVKSSLIAFPSRSFVYPEPFGKVLIIGPWNYPFQLILMPLIGAIAAGNQVVVKPSEFAIETEHIIKTIIKEVFTEDVVQVVSGNHLVSQELLEKQFDYIFFTGSEKVGKVVMQAASKHLTPVTLELGGKSPCIIVDTKDIQLAAKRTAFGKLINAGQTCIAPDYVLIQEKDKEQFIKYFIEATESFYGKDPLNTLDYPKIIHQRHHERLKNLMNGQEVIYGGQYSETKIAPTLLIPKKDSPIMEEEIFGPILPILTFKDLSEIPKLVIDKPLALYLFTDKKDVKDYIITNIQSGGMTINDTLMHFSNHHLGFGGVGKSGMGTYHGKHSFDTFTHYKPVLFKSKLIDISFKYLPSSKQKESIIKKILK